MAGFNPLAIQGNLNRVTTHIVVASFPQLSVTAGYMGKSQANVTFEPPFVDQIETATGIVNSPKPFVMCTISMSLLRSQTLANNWINQVQLQAFLGNVTAYSDSSVFQAIELTNCSISDFEPGAFDGSDPVVKVTVKGTFYVNSTMWAPQTGPAGLLPII